MKCAWHLSSQRTYGSKVGHVGVKVESLLTQGREVWSLSHQSHKLENAGSIPAPASKASDAVGYFPPLLCCVVLLPSARLLTFLFDVDERDTFYTNLCIQLLQSIGLV